MNLIDIFGNLYNGKKVIIKTQYYKNKLYYNFTGECFVYVDVFNKESVYSNASVLKLLHATIDASDVIFEIED